MMARIEVTKQLRTDYQTDTKAEKTEAIDQFCAATGAGRSTARHYLTSEAFDVKT